MSHLIDMFDEKKCVIVCMHIKRNVRTNK